MEPLCDTCIHRAMNDCPYGQALEDEHTVKDADVSPAMTDSYEACLHESFPEIMDEDMKCPRLMIPKMKTVDLSKDFEIDSQNNNEYSMKNSRMSMDEHQILNKIERDNPEIIHDLVRSGIPYIYAEKIVKRIISRTIYYNRH